MFHAEITRERHKQERSNKLNLAAMISGSSTEDKNDGIDGEEELRKEGKSLSLNIILSKLVFI